MKMFKVHGHEVNNVKWDVLVGTESEERAKILAMDFVKKKAFELAGRRANVVIDMNPTITFIKENNDSTAEETCALLKNYGK